MRDYNVQIDKNTPGCIDDLLEFLGVERFTLENPEIVLSFVVNFWLSSANVNGKFCMITLRLSDMSQFLYLV